MYTKTITSERYLEKHSDKKWQMNCPLLVPGTMIGDIEDILFQHQNQSDFRLTIKLLGEFPFNVHEYVEHEKTLDQLFRRIIRHQYQMIAMVVSGANHYRMLENEYYQWEHFLEHVILLDREHLQDINEVYSGLSVKHWRIILEQYASSDIIDDVQCAYFQHVFYEKDIIPVCAVTVPLGSIIQMTLGPESLDK